MLEGDGCWKKEEERKKAQRLCLDCVHKENVDPYEIAIGGWENFLQVDVSGNWKRGTIAIKCEAGHVKKPRARSGCRDYETKVIC